MSKCKNQKTWWIVIVTLGVVALLILAIILAFVFRDDSINHDLLGTWQYNQYTEYVFSADGSGFLCADDAHFEYRYETKGDTVKIDFTDNVVQDCEYTYSVIEDVLTLVGGEGTDKGTYQLKKTQ